MPIKNYRTKVSVSKTVAEIHQLLVRSGALFVATEYDPSGQPMYITFAVSLDGHPLHYRLPRNTEGVIRALKKQRVAASLLRPDHAAAISWRILKDWADAQLAVIEAGQAELAQVFLPYAVEEPRSYVTVYDTFRQQRTKQIGAGGAHGNPRV